MGPGARGGAKSWPSRRWNDRRDPVRSVRVGEIPTFGDITDPKQYRRLLYDWIRFQDLADADSSKKLTLGQQMFSIITSIQGNAGQRLGHIAGIVYAELTREEFTEIVDHILDVVDPLDRESAFLETAKA